MRSANDAMRTFVKDGHLKAGHELAFKPARNYRNFKHVLPYAYKELGPKIHKIERDEENKVITGPPNFVTMPPKVGKVGKCTTFGGVIKHQADDYNIKKEILKKELEYHRSKV